MFVKLNQRTRQNDRDFEAREIEIVAQCLERHRVGIGRKVRERSGRMGLKCALAAMSDVFQTRLNGEPTGFGRRYVVFLHPLNAEVRMLAGDRLEEFRKRDRLRPIAAGIVHDPLGHPAHIFQA